MNRGRIIDVGPTDELRSRYNEPDLEELFFHLVRDDEQKGGEPAAEA